MSRMHPGTRVALAHRPNSSPIPPPGWRCPRAEAFTLIELLVVVAIISLLVAIILPSLNRARGMARELKCLTNISAQIKGLHLYADNNNQQLACGSSDPLKIPGQPPQPPINTIANFQFWLGQNQQPVALGILLERDYIPVKTLACPSDLELDLDYEHDKLVKKSSSFAYGSYLYRQLDGQASATPQNRIGFLGSNTAGRPVTALVLDAQYAIEWPDVPFKNLHEGQRCGIGFVNGDARMVENFAKQFTLRQEDDSTVYERLDSILSSADSYGQ